MDLAFLLTSGVLVLIGLAGTVFPLTGARAPVMQRLPEPLEDDRDALLRALRELEEDHAEGSLRDDDYRTLRITTERRLVAVLRALDEGEQTAFRGVSGERRGERPTEHPRRRPRWMAALLVSLALLAALVPLLAGSLRTRTASQPITGGSLGPGVSANGSSGPLSFFQQRVEQNPTDVAARLDLAYRYLNVGQLGSAVTEYEAALHLDPSNAEAHAYLGLVLYLVQRDAQGLEQVNQALSLDHGYPEALFIRGLILVKGLHRDQAGRAALQAYLRAAPFGSERSLAEKLLGKMGQGPT